MLDKLTYLSATALARAIRTREVSVEEVMMSHVRRIEVVNPQLNAVVQLTVETALQRARAADAVLAQGENTGPLHGVPMTIKDSLNTAGVISAAGTLGRASFIPAQDATVVARLRSAGAILLGKTNTPELTLGGETDNLVYGRTNNPYDLSRSPSGSSGGPAAIIAAGGSPLDIGSDTGGSIRVPAHNCGVAGLKPTAGRVPRTGHIISSGMGVLDALTHLGPMARYVEDLILIFPLITGVDWRDPSIVPMPLGNVETVDLNRLRVVFYTDNGLQTPTPEIVAAIQEAARLLSDEGAIVNEACPAGIQQTYEIFLGLLGADGGTWVQRLLERVGTREVHPLIQNHLLLLHDYKMSTKEFAALIEQWDMFRSTMLAFMANYDVLLCPAISVPALPHGVEFDEDHLFSGTYAWTYNLTGWPCVVVRSGATLTGLPVGVQVVAPPWREDIALAVARQIEFAFGGWQPPGL